jgi:hypothetical protein
LPSTFAKQNSKQDEHTETVVLNGSYLEYCEKIVEDIERQLGAGRATLIVFADKSTLEKYKAKLFLTRAYLCLPIP